MARANQEQEAGRAARQQGDRVMLRTDDAADLPEGSWVGRQDGRLYRSVAGHSLVSVIMRERQDFIRLSEDGYTADDQLRVLAARAGITPQF